MTLEQMINEAQYECNVTKPADREPAFIYLKKLLEIRDSLMRFDEERFQRALNRQMVTVAIILSTLIGGLIHSDFVYFEWQWALAFWVVVGLSIVVVFLVTGFISILPRIFYWFMGDI